MRSRLIQERLPDGSSCVRSPHVTIRLHSEILCVVLGWIPLFRNYDLMLSLHFEKHLPASACRFGICIVLSGEACQKFLIKKSKNISCSTTNLQSNF